MPRRPRDFLRALVGPARACVEPGTGMGVSRRHPEEKRVEEEKKEAETRGGGTKQREKERGQEKRRRQRAGGGRGISGDPLYHTSYIVRRDMYKSERSGQGVGSLFYPDQRVCREITKTTQGGGGRGEGRESSRQGCTGKPCPCISHIPLRKNAILTKIVFSRGGGGVNLLCTYHIMPYHTISTYRQVVY